MENVRKHRDIKLVISKRRQNRLVSEPKHHAAKQMQACNAAGEGIR